MTSNSRINIDTDGMFNEGNSDKTVNKSQIDTVDSRFNTLREKIKQWNNPDQTTFLNLPVTNGLADIKKLGQQILQQFSNTVVFGIGGSSLGGEMLVNTLGSGDHKVKFYDNVDPTTLKALDTIQWQNTCLLVVSKSGNTAETLSQFLSVLPKMNEEIYF